MLNQLPRPDDRWIWMALEIIGKATQLLFIAAMLALLLSRYSAALRHRLWAMVFAGLLGNNKYVLAIATTGSSFGTPGSTQVTDANEAGISGTFATGSSAFPSGNGLAGSTFDFFFDVLPGDANQATTQTSIADATLARQFNNQHETSGTYNPYVDYFGAGQITTADITYNQTHNNVHNSTLTGPTAPAGGLAGDGGSGFTALALGVQETGSSTSGSSASTVSNVSSPGAAPATTTSVSTTSTGSTGSGSAGSSSAATSTTSSRGHGHHSFAATDAAVSDFDLADLWA